MTDIEKRSSDYVMRDRSNFQLKHFVVQQHDTPEMQYKQILLEIKSLIYKIKTAEISRQITEKKIANRLSTGDEIDKLKAEGMRLDLWYGESVLEGAKQELAYLCELSKDYRHYTSDDIEQGQEEYWNRRLNRQAETDRLAVESKVSSGNMAALLQIESCNGKAITS